MSIKNISQSILLLTAFTFLANCSVNSTLNDQTTPPPKGDLKIETLVSTGKSWDGSTLPSYPTGIPHIKILRITIPPKYKLPMHHHPVINAGVLLKGKLKVTKKDGKVLILEQGDPIVEVVDSKHYGENIGDGEAEIIVFYAGEKGKPVTVKDPSNAGERESNP